MLYRLHMGPQVLECLLGKHESVGPWVSRDGRSMADLARQPILADEVQTFKALITIHKVLQEGHPIAIREAQNHVSWLESLMRGVGGDGVRGRTPFPPGVKDRRYRSGCYQATVP
jgi:hypothetical protein